jgi:FkbM family methyltransferase
MATISFHPRGITHLDGNTPEYDDGDVDRGTIEHPLFAAGGGKRSPTAKAGRGGRKRSARHGGIAGTTLSSTSGVARWKVLSVFVLMILVMILAWVNYLLLNELGPGPGAGGVVGRRTTAPARGMRDDDEYPSSAGEMEGVVAVGGSSSREREMRLASLRKKVEKAREDVRAMRGMVDRIRTRKEGEKGRRRDDDRSRMTIRGNVVGVDGEGDGGGGGYPRLTCAPDVARKQAARLNERFREWWSHSACPDQAWMETMIEIFEAGSSANTNTNTKTNTNRNTTYLMLDVGCNKGYASSEFLDSLSPGSGINPSSLVDAIRYVSKQTNTKIDRDGGVCNDSKRALNRDRTTLRNAEVHCFEPSPATYNMLKLARSKLMKNTANGAVGEGDDDGGGGAMWNIHNLGLHSEVGDMTWHPACANAVGDELCTIVPDGTMEGAITVPVVTVDRFLEDAYPAEGGAVVHLLKIDAEGLDPAVLAGSTNLLTRSGAILVTFEFNPRLSEGKDNPHGMWGGGGNPRKDLLEVTNWLDDLGYDCYLDSKRVDDGERRKGVPDAPALYRITGNCLVEEPRVRGWANVVCASRRYEKAASALHDLATLV